MFRSKPLCILMLATLASALAVGQTKKLTAQQIYQKYARYVVTIKTKNGTGTGFIDRYSRVYTCYHVIENAPSITIRFYDGREVTTSNIVALDRDKDVAILDSQDIYSRTEYEYFKGEKKDEVPADLGDFAGTKVGEKIVVLGSPLGLDGSITEGLISAKRQVGGKDYIQLSASVSHGSSGSPVFGESGDIVGMVTSGIDSAQGINFAISSKDLKGVTGIPLALISGSSSSGATTSKTKEGKSMIRQAIENQDLAENTLWYFIAAQVQIETLEEKPTFELKPSHIKEPVEKLLKELKIHLITDDEKQKLADMKDESDELLFTAQDALHSSINIGWDVVDLENGTKSVSISLGIYRGALLRPYLFVPVQAFFDIEMETVKANESVGDAIKKCMTSLLDKFKTKYKEDNGLD
jgi:hypothetical protein